MKKWIFIISIPILITILIVLIYDDKIKENNKIITISQFNSYICDEEINISIPFYVNNNDLNYENKTIYENFFITDESLINVFEVELTDVTYSHAENMQKHTYFKYYFKFKMKNIASSINIDKAYLKFNFINNEKINLKIGSFIIYKLNNEDEITLIDDLYAKREKGLIINQIVIDNININGKLENIHFGNNKYLPFNNQNNKIIIEIESELYIDNVPIILETTNNTYFINNFTYIEDYKLLNNNTTLINIYELN